MVPDSFHFTHPLWLLAFLVVPAVWALVFFQEQNNSSFRQLEKFIDKHLLPYLLLNKSDQKYPWKSLLLWTIVWSALSLAIAGPRWDYRDIETFSKDQSLVILLDLSESMNATDSKPSRLIRAKQKIEDLLNMSKGVKIGLIAFAADPHMISPMTDDKETIRHLLPTLDTALVHVQGSKLSPAFEMALRMLENEPGSNKSIVVMSDGGFEDASAIITAKKLAKQGIVIHALGFGTVEGAPIKDTTGNIIKKNGVPVISKLEKERFSAISNAGNGNYIEAHYSNDGEAMILKDLEKRAEIQMLTGKKNRLWEEHFYLFIIPALPIMLWWFRKGKIFAVFLFFLLSTCGLEAEIEDYFKNREQRGEEAFTLGNYEMAAASFEDPYRKGVSLYKAGQFAEAEEMFRASSRPDIACSAEYNLGNALAGQQKLKEAKLAYEEVLKKCPDHVKAKENLELVKKMLEEQKKEKKKNQENNDDQKKDENDDQNEDSENQNKKNKDKKDKNQNQEQENDQQKNEQQDKGDKPEEEDKEESGNKEDKEQEEGQSEDLEKDEKEAKGEEEKEESSPSEIKEEEKQEKEEQGKQAKGVKTEEDHNADLWLNRIESDPKTFMKNKFYIESKKNGTTQGIDPW